MIKRMLLFLALMLGSVSQAQQLDLQTCLKMADTANITIRNARLDVAINAKQIDAYNTARLPKLNFAGDYKYNAVLPANLVPAQFFGGTPGTYAKLQFGVPFNLSNTVQLSQVVYNPQVNYGIAALKLNQKVIEIQAEMAELDVKYQVSSTFFNIQALKKQEEFLQANLENVQKLLANTDLIVKEGLSLETELDKLKINQLSLMNSLQTVQASKAQLESVLKILIGLDEKQTLQLVSDELVQKSILHDKENVHHPELDLIDTQLELNKEEKSGTKMAYLPSLSFYAIYNYTYNIKPEDNFRTGINSAFLGLKLDWNLFDGLEKQHTLKKNALTREKMEAQKELMTQQLQLQTENAQRQIAIQINSLDIAKEQLALAEKIYKQSSLQFQEGVIGSNELIMADNALQQAQTNLVSAFVQLRQAELTFLKSIGNLK